MDADHPQQGVNFPRLTTADGVEFADGTSATVAHMADDVSHFLAWTSETKLEERKRLGLKVMIFLIIMTALLYAVKRRVWSDQH